MKVIKALKKDPTKVTKAVLKKEKALRQRAVENCLQGLVWLMFGSNSSRRCDKLIKEAQIEIEQIFQKEPQK